MTLSTKNEEVVDLIFQRVFDNFGYSREELVGRSRTARICYARWVAMVAIRRATDIGLKEIGQLFDRDHGTVIHALSRIKTAEFQEQVSDALLGVEPKRVYTPDPSIGQVTKLLLDAQEALGKATEILAKVENEKGQRP